MTTVAYRQSGFSLLEVLVAAVIMAVGLAGLAALLLEGVAGTASAEYRTTANLLADSLVAQMLLTPGQEATFLANPPLPAPDCRGPVSCSPEQFAAHGFEQWRTAVSDALPAGLGIVCRDGSPGDGAPDSPSCDGAGSLVVKIFWRSRLQSGSGFARHAVAAAS